MSDLFPIIPEPKLDESYAVDKTAMLSYYQRLFSGRALEDVLRLLGTGQILHSPPVAARPEPGADIDFDTSVDVTLKTSFAPLPAAYTVQMQLVFFSDRFVGVNKIFNPGLIVP